MTSDKKFSTQNCKLIFQRFCRQGPVYIILLFVVGFNLWSLQPEIRGDAGLHGDKTYHLQLAKSAVSAIKTGNNVTDPWDSTMGTGFAVFHYYNHLPHIVLALIYVSLFESVALIDLLTWSIYFLLSFFPLTVYWSLCRLGFHPSIGVMASLLSSLVGYGFIGGISSENFVFQGWGLYSQLCGLLLLPLMLSAGYEVIIKGKPYLWAVLLCSVTLMSHLVFAYMGPSEEKPAFPLFDTFDMPGYVSEPRSQPEWPCNWLQMRENAMDPVHLRFLHTMPGNVGFSEDFTLKSELDYMETPVGVGARKELWEFPQVPL